MSPAGGRILPALERLGSAKVAMVALGLLMILVAWCTLAQVHLGTFGAVEAVMRPFWISAALPGTRLRIPVFPGGAAVGLLLAVNLAAALLTRLKPGERKPGLMLAHLGLLLLVAGEFAAGRLADEAIMPIEEGAVRGYTESQRDAELALVDVTATDRDRVYAVPAARLARGGTIADPRLPVRISVAAWHPNARLEEAPARAAAATAGAGARLRAVPLPRAAAEDESDTPAAVVGIEVAGAGRGTWLVSTALEPQSFSDAGRRYTLCLRPRRHYLPFALALKDFRHDVYPGTDIPRNFSSLVRLTDPERGEDRDVLIYMNHPLRYRGLTFYQASFGKDDTLSVFQVVRNPVWRLPYAACGLVALGLLIHFARALRQSAETRP